MQHAIPSHSVGTKGCLPRQRHCLITTQVYNQSSGHQGEVITPTNYKNEQ